MATNRRIKDPSLPATDPQIGLITRLLDERVVDVHTQNALQHWIGVGLNMGLASGFIELIANMPKLDAAAKAQQPASALGALAQKVSGVVQLDAS